MVKFHDTHSRCAKSYALCIISSPVLNPNDLEWPEEGTEGYKCVIWTSGTDTSTDAVCDARDERMDRQTDI